MQNDSVIIYLNFFHGFVKFAKGVAILGIFVAIGSSIFNPNQIDIPIQYKIAEVGTMNFRDTTNNSVMIYEGDGLIRYKTTKDAPFTSMAAFNIFFNIVAAFAAYFIYFFLEKIIRSAINKKPFSKENADSMLWLGYILIGYGIMSSIYHIAGLIFLDIHFSTEILQQGNFGASFLLNLLSIFFGKRTLLGFFALLVSLILRYGIALKEEQALTI